MVKTPRRPALAGGRPRGGLCHPPAPGSRAGVLIPRARHRDPRLGKPSTCLLGFIRFQGEATGFTLKITKLANSFDMQMFFCICGPNYLKVQLFFHRPNLFVFPEQGGAVGWSGPFWGHRLPATPVEVWLGCCRLHGCLLPWGTPLWQRGAT